MFDLPKVFAWRPKVFRQLFGNPSDVNHLTGLSIENIPARVNESTELDYLKEILGVQKLKSSVDTRVIFDYFPDNHASHDICMQDAMKAIVTLRSYCDSRFSSF